jgi:hypothetical protein
MNLVDIEKTFSNYLSSLNQFFFKTFNKAKNYKSFDLNGTEITEAILTRLKAYYDFNYSITRFLNKRKVAPASDFFVETVLFYLNAYFLSKQNGLVAKSEISLEPKFKPDISIWMGNIPIAIIECKTQLGRERFEWEQNFINRENQLKSINQDAKSFLLVLTERNWSGFRNNKNFGVKYFCLLNGDTWPNDYSNISQILSPFEGLINKIVNI